MTTAEELFRGILQVIQRGDNEELQRRRHRIQEALNSVTSKEERTKILVEIAKNPVVMLVLLGLPLSLRDRANIVLRRCRDAAAL